MLTASFLAVALVVALNGRVVLDTVNYYQYQPTDSIAAFAVDAGMSEKGKYLFFASKPSIEGSDTFEDLCGTTESTTAILGCYNGQRIYIFNVTDPRLSGIRETTAAHEMLHAAYARLSEEQRQKVDRLIDAEYQKLKTDKSLQDRLAFYDRTEPGERYNELHSMIGTEVSYVSPELNEHYAKYFDDRSKVVALYQKYNSIFQELNARAEEIKRQLDSLYTTINEQSELYNSETAGLQRAVDSFNSKTQRGEFSSQSEFDLERRRLVARMSDLEAMRASINSYIDRYKQLEIELKSIATETNELNQSLDSSLAPAPSI